MQFQAQMPKATLPSHRCLFAAMATCLIASSCSSEKTPGNRPGIADALAAPDTDLASLSGDAAGVDTTPSLQLGINDATAAKGCAALEGASALAPITVVASPTEADAEAAQAKIAVDGSKAFVIQLAEGKEGWITLDEDTWDVTVAFFVAGDTAYEIKHAQAAPETNGPRINAACPASNVTDYRVFFHHWTTATLRFAATGPRQVKLFAVKLPKA